jgi:hypothetical protein
MDFFVLVVQSPGYIFGPLMMLAGLVALGMCARATLRPERLAARQSLVWSLLPTALGVVGAVVGAIVWALAGPAAPAAATAFASLGCTILFGAFITVIPAIWSLALLRRRPTAFA